MKCPVHPAEYQPCKYCFGKQPSAVLPGYRLEDANLIREGAEAACRTKMLLQCTGNAALVSYYAVLHTRLEDLANRVEL